MVLAIDFLRIPKIQQRLERAPKYFKNAETLLRLAKKDEIGHELITYILDRDKAITPETSNRMTPSKVVARNPVALDPTKQVYNEWLIKFEDVIKIYGQSALDSLTENFSKHPKKTLIKAIPITQEIIDIFEEFEAIEKKIIYIKSPCSQELIPSVQKILHINAPWGQEMLAYENDFLTDGGYSISANDMKPYMLYDETQRRTSVSQTSPVSTASHSRHRSTASTSSMSSFSDFNTRSSVSSTCNSSSFYSPVSTSRSLGDSTRESIDSEGFNEDFVDPDEGLDATYT